MAHQRFSRCTRRYRLKFPPGLLSQHSIMHQCLHVIQGVVITCTLLFLYAPPPHPPLTPPPLPTPATGPPFKDTLPGARAQRVCTIPTLYWLPFERRTVLQTTGCSPIWGGGMILSSHQDINRIVILRVFSLRRTPSFGSARTNRGSQGSMRNSWTHFLSRSTPLSRHDLAMIIPRICSAARGNLASCVENLQE